MFAARLTLHAAAVAFDTDFIWQRTEQIHPYYGLGSGEDAKVLSGFELDAVYTHYTPTNGVTHPFAHPFRHKIVRHDVSAARRRLTGDQENLESNAARARRLAPLHIDLSWLDIPLKDQPSWTTKREKVLTMAKLMVLADPLNYTSRITSLKESVYTDNVQNFGTDEGNYQSDMDVWFREQRDYMEINNISGADFPVQADCYPNPSSQGFSVGCEHREHLLKDFFGVSMLAYKNPNTNQLILFFRGSYGKGLENIQNWIAYWVLEKMEQQVQNQWTTAGNALTDDMKNRFRNGFVFSDKGVYDSMLRGGFKKIVSSYLSALSSKVPAKDSAEALEMGYWPLTKAIVRDYLPADRDKAAEVIGSVDSLGDSIYIGGHSQGGARAAFVHMWLHTQDGQSYDTTTLAAASGQCVAHGKQHVLAGGTYEGDIDLTKEYPALTQYVDVFDVFGHFDIKSAGSVCTYGTSDQLSRPARKYFEKIVGVPGSILMGTGLQVGGLSVDDFAGLGSQGDEIHDNFATTRYYTHGALSMAANMHRSDYIMANGTTDGQCVKQPVVDHVAVCPTGEATADEQRFSAWTRRMKERVQGVGGNNISVVCCDEGRPCCMQNKLVGDYSFAAAFAKDGYVKNRTNGQVVLLGDVFEDTPGVCKSTRAEVIKTLRGEFSFGGYLKQGTDATVYQLLPTTTHPSKSTTFVVAFRGSEGAECLAHRKPGEACDDFIEDWVNTDLQGWGQSDSICPTNSYSAPLWYTESDKVHLGFQSAYLSVRDELRSTLSARMGAASTLYITGHSLGGALATLAGYDFTCNKLMGIEPKVITIAAPAVFKDQKRFMNVVKERHYLRVVAEGKQKDIITTAASVLAYNQPTYRYLKLDVNIKAGDDFNCVLGQCHAVQPAYMNSKVAAEPIFQRKCEELEPSSVTSLAMSVCNHTCAAPLPFLIQASTVLTYIEINLPKLTVEAFAPRSRTFTRTLAKLLQVSAEKFHLLSISPVTSGTLRRRLAGLADDSDGIKVVSTVLTPEDSTAGVREDINDPAFENSMQKAFELELELQDSLKVPGGTLDILSQTSDGTPAEESNTENTTSPALRISAAVVAVLSVCGAVAMILYNWNEGDDSEDADEDVPTTESQVALFDHAVTVFAEMDADGDGSLSEDEIRHHLKKVGYGEKAIGELMDSYKAHNLDADHDGSIRYVEFKAYLDKEGACKDASQSLVVSQSRPKLEVIQKTWESVVYGHAVEMVVTDTDNKALPQLNPRNDHQYRWIQYMVWRKWMLGAALLVSVVMACLIAASTTLQLQNMREVVNRCDTGSSMLIKAASGDLEDRSQLMSRVTTPISKNISAFRYKCDPPASRRSYAKGESLKCATKHQDSEWWEAADAGVGSGANHSKANPLVATCAWFPYAPWLKEPAAPPMGAAQGNVTTMGDLHIVTSTEFLTHLADAGCGVDNKQHMQMQHCVCGYNVNVFSDYTWMKIDASKVEDFLRTDGVQEQLAQQQNLVQFVDPKFCQAPTYAEICSGAGCVKRDDKTGGDEEVAHVHKEKCTVRTENGTDVDGVVGTLGTREVCYFSPESWAYPPGTFPESQTRECCSSSEYVFKKLVSDSGDQFYAILLASCKLIFVLNYMICTALGVYYWSHWNFSRKMVLLAWVCPFVVKFVAFSVPAYDAQDVNAKLVANLTVDYWLNQLGYSSYDTLRTTAKLIAVDAVRVGMMGTGVSALSGEGNALFCGAGSKHFQSLRDTFDSARLTTIEQHVVRNGAVYPKMQLEFQNTTVGATAAQLGFGEQSQCAAMYQVASDVCTAAVVKAQLPLPAECQLCSDPVFCDLTSIDSKRNGCCGSCMGVMDEVKAEFVGAGEPLSSPEHITAALQSQAWVPVGGGKGYVDCVGAEHTEATKQCTAQQAHLPLAQNLARMFSCTPFETLKFLQSAADRTPFRDTHQVPVLGECGNVSGTVESGCYASYKMLPMSLDMQLPYAMDNVQRLMDLLHGQMTEKGALAIMSAVRVSATLKSIIGIFPLTLAFLPGLARGATRTKQVVPQSSLIGHVKVIAPVLQLPMFGIVLAIIIQMGGTWKVCFAVYFWLAGQQLPLIPAMRGTAPHMTTTTFNLATRDATVSALSSACFGMALAMVLWEFASMELLEIISVEELIGSVATQILLVGECCLAYFLGQTLTVIMSSDMLLNLLTYLETYQLLCPDVTKACRDRMVAGLLLSTRPSDAAELLKKYDTNGDGMFDEREIRCLMSDVRGGHIRILNKLERRAAREQQRMLEKKISAIRDKNAVIRRKSIANGLLDDVGVEKGVEKDVRASDVVDSEMKKEEGMVEIASGRIYV